MLIGGGLGIVAGRLCDKYGPRPLVTIGGCVTGISLLLVSQITSFWQVYVIWGFLMGIPFGCVFISVTSTIALKLIKMEVKLAKQAVGKSLS